MKIRDKMRSFQLNKLIRDNVLKSMQELGQRITYHRLTDKQFLPALNDKLLEEAKEFDPKDAKAVNELADLLEVIEAIGQELGQSFDKLREAQLKLREERGGFKERYYVAHLELDDDDPWVKYYAAEPERFPEEQ